MQIFLYVLLSVTTKSYIQKNSHDYKCTTDELSFLSKHFEKKIYSFFSKVGAYTVGLYSDFKIHSKSAKLERVKILFRFQRTTIYDERNLCCPLFPIHLFSLKDPIFIFLMFFRKLRARKTGKCAQLSNSSIGTISFFIIP